MSNGTMVLEKLTDLYLRYRPLKVLASNLTPRHHTDQTRSLNELRSSLGKGQSMNCPFRMRSCYSWLFP